MEMGINVMSILRIFLVVIGIITAGWGFYDLFSENGAQSGGAIKKILGGIAFAIVMYFIMGWAIGEIELAADKAGVTKTSAYTLTEHVEHTPRIR